MSTVTILPATKEWAYPDMASDFKGKSTDTIWREVTEDFKYQALCVMPPIMIHGTTMFMVGEEYDVCPVTGKPVFAGFAEMNGRYFARYDTVPQFKLNLHALRQHLSKVTA